MGMEVVTDISIGMDCTGCVDVTVQCGYGYAYG